MNTPLLQKPWARPLALAIALVALATSADAGSSQFDRLDPVVDIGLDSEAPPLGSVASAAFLPDGTLLVVESHTGTVQAFGQRGEWLGQFSSVGEGPGEYYSPSAIAADQQGDVYIACAGRRITICAKDGSPKGQIQRSSDRAASALVAGVDDDLYVCAWDFATETMIRRYDVRTGDSLATFGRSFVADMAGRPIDVQQEQALAGGQLAIWSGGIVYSQNWPQRLELFAPDGESLQRFEARSMDAGELPEVRRAGGTVSLQFPPTFSQGVAVLGDHAIVGFYRNEESGGECLWDMYDLRTGERLATRRVDHPGQMILASQGSRLAATRQVEGVPVVTIWELSP